MRNKASAMTDRTGRRAARALACAGDRSGQYLGQYLGQRLLQRLGRFARDTRGTVTMEFVLWVPVFVGLLMLFADTSLTYMNQSNFWNVGRETARIVARHGMDPEAAADFAESRASFGSYRPKATVTVEEGWVTVTISADPRAISLFGILNFARGAEIETRVSDVMEPI